MTIHRIIITDPALADLASIAVYIAEFSPDASERISEEIRSAIRSLAFMPWKFVQVGVSRKAKLPVHRMVVDPHNIYYRIEGDAVYVLMIRHGKRRQPKRFE